MLYVFKMKKRTEKSIRTAEDVGKHCFFDMSLIKIETIYASRSVIFHKTQRHLLEKTNSISDSINKNVLREIMKIDIKLWNFYLNTHTHAALDINAI
jgi:hypothetical protein